MRTLFLTAAMVAGLAAPALCRAENPAAWTRPTAPFRVVGDIYYVGTEGLSSFLIVGPQGDVLIDGTMPENPPLIEANIRKLGFDPRDVKILLLSHAHFDHAGGLAQLKADTGARLLVSQADRESVETGLHGGETTYPRGRYPKAKVDATLKDGETVSLGPIQLTAVLTPGHTPGCTTWTLTTREGARDLKVVMPCSLTVAGNVLIGNKTYPGIVGDFRRSLDRVAAMKADVVLTAHPEFAQMMQRKARRDAGDAEAFIDPAFLSRFVKDARADFEADYAKAAKASR